ncbi:MAG: sulfatase-like hydrolase/transferase [Actinomycetota bacterium]|nr:sulfatase-like hydrolase/transferase [Actinomycetota bacterium]
MASGPIPDGPSLVLVVADTARADTFANSSLEALRLNEEVIHSGRLYRRATSPSSWTAPSHASMFTGLAPSEHGIWKPNLFDADGRPRTKLIQGELAARWLPVKLAGSGYHTLGISANPWIAPSLGCDVGFERFLSLKKSSQRWAARSLSARLARRAPDSVATYVRRRRLGRRMGQLGPDVGARRTLETITEWLAGRERPYFAFLNFMEPHWPYLPPERFEGFSSSERHHAVDLLARLGRFKQFWIDAYMDGTTLEPYDLKMLRRLYAGEVSYLQSRILELIERVDEASGLDSTVLVIVSDHGEQLGEHGLFGHGSSLYEELVHVPLMVFGPEDLVGRGVEERRISTQALYRTILGWANGERTELHSDAPTLADNEGLWYHPLVQRRLAGKPPEERLKATSWAVYEDRWKYVRNQIGNEVLYDLDDDPTESRDVGSAGPLEKMRDLMAGSLAGRRPSLVDGSSISATDPDPDVEAELRALGYM